MLKYRGAELIKQWKSQNPAEKPPFPILCELKARRLQEGIDSARLHTRVQTHTQTGKQNHFRVGIRAIKRAISVHIKSPLTRPFKTYREAIKATYFTIPKSQGFLFPL